MADLSRAQFLAQLPPPLASIGKIALRAFTTAERIEGEGGYVSELNPIPWSFRGDAADEIRHWKGTDSSTK